MYASDPENSTSGSVVTGRAGSKDRDQTKRDTKTNAESSVNSSGLKHRANDARDVSNSYSKERDQSGLKGCCTAMWKADAKTTILSFFLDSLFPKTEMSNGRLIGLAISYVGTAF